MQIQWNRLLAVVEERGQTLIRPTLGAGGGRYLCRSLRHPRPDAGPSGDGHAGACERHAASVGFFLEKFPIETMAEGDVFLTNDPWKGTGHLNDFTMVTPTFMDGRCVALFACTTHVVDVGGRGFGPDEEGPSAGSRQGRDRPSPA